MNINLGDYVISIFDAIDDDRQKIYVRHLPTNACAWDYGPGKPPSPSYFRVPYGGIKGLFGMTRLVRVPSLEEEHEVHEKKRKQTIERLIRIIEEFNEKVEKSK